MTEPLPEPRKICITFRVEPGCLGPEGIHHVDQFCVFAQDRFAHVDAEFVRWQITPRHDKALAETEYGVAGKRITNAQADRYAQALGHSLDELEDHLHTTLANLIDEFMRG